MNSSRNIRLISALLLAVLLFLAASALASSESHYEQVEINLGTGITDGKINVRSAPDVSSERVGRMTPGETCLVTGESGDWWQVEFKGRICYIRKDLMEVSTVLEEVLVIVEDPLDAKLTGLKPPTILQYRNDYTIEGVIHSNIPLTRVSVEIYNLRTLSVERSISATMTHEQNVLEYDLRNLADQISFRKLNPGEKRLIVRAESTNDRAVLSGAFFYVYTDGRQYADATSITGDCRFTVPRRTSVDDLTDNACSTSITLHSPQENITIDLPADSTPGGLSLWWKYAPDRVTIELLAEDGSLLQTIEETNPQRMIHFFYPLSDSTRAIRITSDTEKRLSEVRVYDKNFISPVVQQWQPLPEKLDLLVISAHQDDELLFYGGTIPYYVAQGKQVGVIYMADCGRRRYSEALDGLWSCGLQYHPIFVGLKDARLDSYQEAADLWGMEGTENTLIELIRKYQPEVIVTHDVNGEYGHNQHKVTCAAVRSAVTKAGDAAFDADSAAQYGVWTPKKLYIHLYEDNAITMDIYDQPVDSLGGMNMTQIATIGYSKHVSQQEHFTMEKHGVRYDNRKYGLAFTTVGQDVEKNDFFENID